MCLGVNFYDSRQWWKKFLSGVIISINILICSSALRENEDPNFSGLYFIVYVCYLTSIEPFNADVVATNFGFITFVLQAMLSVVSILFFSHSKNFPECLLQTGTSAQVFLAFWQSDGMACQVLRQLYAANHVSQLQGDSYSLSFSLFLFLHAS